MSNKIKYLSPAHEAAALRAEHRSLERAASARFPSSMVRIEVHHIKPGSHTLAMLAAKWGASRLVLS